MRGLSQYFSFVREGEHPEVQIQSVLDSRGSFSELGFPGVQPCTVVLISGISITARRAEQHTLRGAG